MKEATSELSSLLVVAASVAILVAFFFFTLWPKLQNNFNSQTACEKAICGTKPDSKGMVKCRYKDQTITCKYKG